MRNIGSTVFCVFVFFMPVGVHADTFVQFVLGGPADGYRYEAELQVSSMIDLETSWEVRIQKTGAEENARTQQSGPTEIGPWPSAWSVDGMEQKALEDGYENVFEFTLEPRGTEIFKLTGSSEMAVGWMLISSKDEDEEYFYGSSILSSSLYLQLWKDDQLVQAIGAPSSRYGFQQIMIPVTRSSGVNTGIASLVVNAKSDNPIIERVFTLYGEDGSKIDRIQEDCESRACHDSRFISEIFPDLPETFTGAVRISIDESADETKVLTPGSPESTLSGAPPALHLELAKKGHWMTGTAFRMNEVSDVVGFSPIPVDSVSIPFILKKRTQESGEGE